MYETGDSVETVAFHSQPGLPPPEGVRHSHRYRVEVAVSGVDLDSNGMLIDLDLLSSTMREVAGRLDGADLDRVIGPSTTVERMARWVHAELSAALCGRSELQLAARVRVWESPTAYGGYGAALGGS